MQKICVYCGSSSQVNQIYFEAAASLGKLFAKESISLVYGGGSLGLMGEIATSALNAGGNVIGIIPRFMCDEKWNHSGLTNLIQVETMHERKQMMANIADAAVALPGGCGTLEELLEIITWKQLGLFTKPIIIVNLDGYFNPMLEMLKKTVDEQFMRQEHCQMWEVVETPEKVIEAIHHSVKWDKNFRKFAAI